MKTIRISGNRSPGLEKLTGVKKPDDISLKTKAVAVFTKVGSSLEWWSNGQCKIPNGVYELTHITSKGMTRHFYLWRSE